MKHRMKQKRKLRMSSSKNSILNLLQKMNVLIAQAVLGGKMELQNREGIVCKFTSYKAKEAILKRARRIKPEGLNIFEDQQLRRQWRKEGHNCLSSNKPKINLLTSPSTNS